MKFILAFIIIFSLSGCFSIDRTKADVRAFSLGEAEILEGEYHALARKWDEHATRLSVDFAPATTLNYDGPAKTAVISVQGSVALYGFIELTAIDSARTRMTAYGWDRGINRTLAHWMKIIREPTPQKSPGR